MLPCSLNIKVSDGLYINGLFPDDLVKAICSDLTIENPKYYEAKKYGRSTRKIEATLTLYKINHNKTSIRAPRGYMRRLLLLLKEVQIPYLIEDHRVAQPVIYPALKGELRDYQRPVIKKAYERQEGVIESPCGSGKTFMGLFLLARCGQRSLWITHTRDLLSQTIAAIESILNIPKEMIGVIGEGRRELGPIVTIALAQSLIKLNPHHYSKEFGALIVDEAHRVPCKTFKGIVEKSAAKYRFGLTATPKRNDGLESILFYVMGQVLYRITEKDLAQAKQIIIPHILTVPTSFSSTKADNHNALIGEMIRDPKRNNHIIEVIIETMEDGDRALVLSSRVEHCKLLKTALDSLSHRRASVLTGEVSKKERERIVLKTKNGAIDILIATKIADEGLDIPELTNLYLVTPIKSKAKLKQQLGRVMRPSQGKKEALVFDFIDEKIPLLKRQSQRRALVYHQLECVVESYRSL